MTLELRHYYSYPLTKGASVIWDDYGKWETMDKMIFNTLNMKNVE